METVREDNLDVELVRYGTFVVLDRGWRTSMVGRGKRFAVVEHDHKGPILRHRPVDDLDAAMAEAKQLASSRLMVDASRTSRLRG